MRRRAFTKGATTTECATATRRQTTVKALITTKSGNGLQPGDESKKLTATGGNDQAKTTACD
jgi:hypothetical protein